MWILGFTSLKEVTDSTHTHTHTTFSPILFYSLQIESAFLIDLLASMEKKTGAGIVKALATNNGLSPTYFSYECLDFFSVSGKVYCREFKMHTLPLFLEGPVRHMKVVNDQARAREILRLAKVKLFLVFLGLLALHDMMCRGSVVMLTQALTQPSCYILSVRTACLLRL